mmetsp:Transcript_34775/g.76037  ORF Transcript_34775/g.76037 Transcript_34775/m.76037 type:complete len:283 (-) Transcript_34775:1275-2123(-)
MSTVTERCTLSLSLTSLSSAMGDGLLPSPWGPHACTPLLLLAAPHFLPSLPSSLPHCLTPPPVPPRAASASPAGGAGPLRPSIRRAWRQRGGRPQGSEGLDEAEQLVLAGGEGVVGGKGGLPAGGGVALLAAGGPRRRRRPDPPGGASVGGGAHRAGHRAGHRAAIRVPPRAPPLRLQSLRQLALGVPLVQLLQPRRLLLQLLLHAHLEQVRLALLHCLEGLELFVAAVLLIHPPRFLVLPLLELCVRFVHLHFLDGVGEVEALLLELEQFPLVHLLHLVRV